MVMEGANPTNTPGSATIICICFLIVFNGSYSRFARVLPQVTTCSLVQLESWRLATLAKPGTWLMVWLAAIWGALCSTWRQKLVCHLFSMFFIVVDLSPLTLLAECPKSEWNTAPVISKCFLWDLWLLDLSTELRPTQCKNRSFWSHSPQQVT